MMKRRATCPRWGGERRHFEGCTKWRWSKALRKIRFGQTSLDGPATQRGDPSIWIGQNVGRPGASSQRPGSHYRFRRYNGVGMGEYEVSALSFPKNSSSMEGRQEGREAPFPVDSALPRRSSITERVSTCFQEIHSALPQLVCMCVLVYKYTQTGFG